MKIFLQIIFMLFIASHAYGKFSRSAFDTPCTQLRLDIKSCEDKSFLNKDYQKAFSKALKPSQHIIFKGALVKAIVIDSKPAQCRPKQKMNLKLYKEKTFQNESFFIEDHSCKEVIKSKYLSAVIEKTFCDTPGALMIRECFIDILTRQEKLLFTQKR